MSSSSSLDGPRFLSGKLVIAPQPLSPSLILIFTSARYASLINRAIGSLKTVFNLEEKTLVSAATP